MIKALIDEGVEPSDIMVLSRFNNDLKEVEVFCGANGIPTEYQHGGVKFWSVHKSKGSESNHVILIEMKSGLYGFPCEVQDSSVLEVAKRIESKGYIEDERRLFYVGLTRAKNFLYLFGVEGNESTFIDEVVDHVERIHVDEPVRWSTHVSPFLHSLITGVKADRVLFCPHCGKAMVERNGKNGLFLGCKGYPDCRYIVDVERRVDRNGTRVTKPKETNVQYPDTSSLTTRLDGKNYFRFGLELEIKCQTEKAILMGSIWIPKSQMIKKDGYVWITDWIARQKGLIKNNSPDGDSFYT